MSRKTTYTMREYRELMRRAEEAGYWEKIHVTVYADDLPTSCGFEDWEIPVEDMMDFVNVICSTYNISSIELSDSKCDYDWIDIDLYNNNVSIH